MRKIILLCILSGVCLTGFLYGCAPGANSQYQTQGVGGVVWSHRQSVTTTQACIQDGASNCMGFPAAVQHPFVLVTRASADIRCCWLGDSSLAFAGFTVTDVGAGNGTTEGACFSTGTSGGRWDQKPNYEDFAMYKTGGFRGGLCEIPTARGGITGHLPCDANGDCPSGNCDLSPDNELENALYYLSCEQDTATGNVDFSLDKVNG